MVLASPVLGVAPAGRCRLKRALMALLGGLLWLWAMPASAESRQKVLFLKTESGAVADGQRQAVVKDLFAQAQFGAVRQRRGFHG